MKCKKLTIGNTQCKANAMKNSEFCYIHNPEIPDNEKQENRRKGANKPKTRKSTFNYLSKFKIKSDEDIPEIVLTIMNEYRAGIIHDKTAQTLGNLCGVLVKAYAQKNSKLLEDILEKLEQTETANQYRNAG